MDYKEMVAFIAGQSGKSEQDIEKHVYQKRKKLSMIITEVAAAKLVAHNLGIDLPEEEKDGSMSGDGVTGSGDVLTVTSFAGLKNLDDNRLVNLKCAVYYVKPVKEFTRKNGLPGKVVSAGIFDSNNQRSRLVFWGDECTRAGDLSPGDEILIEEIKVRTSNFGQRWKELHVTGNTVISKLGRVPVPESFNGGGTSRTGVTLKLDEISDQRNITTSGEVSEILEVHDFQRQDGTPGKLGKVVIHEPGTDTRVTVLLWGDKADLVNGLQVGTVIHFTNCYAKKGELNVSKYSQVRTEKQGSVLQGVQGKATQ